MIEEQVQLEIIATDVEMHLAADQSNPHPELEHEVTQMGQEPALELALVGILGDSQKVKIVWVLEQQGGQVRLRRGEAALEITDGLALAGKEGWVSI